MPIFERLQKPFLTVETGEAYQPIRLTYTLFQKDKLIESLKKLKCLEKNLTASSWNWFWKNECANLHFESLNSYQQNPQHPLRLGTLTIRNNKVFINLPSFKRACLAVPFFNRFINADIAKIDKADFINKVFGLDERLPHGFAELFKEDELENLISERLHDYAKVQEQVEQASSAEIAFEILAKYTAQESKKRLPYAERYDFNYQANETVQSREQENAEFSDSKISEVQDPDVIFLGFYIFLRSRELVAIRRWFGELGYSLADAADETVEQVFGGMDDIDIIE